MEYYNWAVRHWVEIGVAWLAIIKILTNVQDAIDAEPKDLKPPFGKILYYMSALSQSLFLGNRPQAIGGTNAKVNSSVSDSANTVVK